MTLSALAAAVLYGTGAALEQRQAAAAPAASAGRARLLVLLARQPLWLAGLAAQAGGFAVHAVALRSGPLALVQMMVACELIVAVLLVGVWAGRPLGRAAWAAAVAVVAGIASFSVLAAPAGGHAAGPGGNAGPLLALAATVTGAAAAAVAAAGLRSAGRRRAVLLAVAAGLADACSAVITTAFAHQAGHGLATLATSWPAYALVVSGLGNVLLTQTAYQAGYPVLTLPVISAVTPAASVAIGVCALGELPGNGLAGLIAAGLAVAVTSAALACLARSVPAQRPSGAGRVPGVRRGGRPSRRARVTAASGPGTGSASSLAAIRAAVAVAAAAMTPMRSSGTRADGALTVIAAAVTPGGTGIGTAMPVAPDSCSSKLVA